MPAPRGVSAAKHPGAESARSGESAGAAERIDAVCKLTVAGKLAARDLAGWVRGFSVAEVEFRLLWLLYRSAEGEWASRTAVAAAAPGPDAHFDQARLAEQLAVSTAQVSSVVERLQARQLVAGLRDSGDRRRQLWRLTEAGAGLVQQVMRSVAESVQRAATIPHLAPPCAGAELPEAA